MPKWVEKILKYNPGEKSLKTPFAIPLGLECSLNNNNNNNNNLQKSYTEKKSRHEPSDCTMFTRCSLIKKKINLIITEEKLCKKLKDHFSPIQLSSPLNSSAN